MAGTLWPDLLAGRKAKASEVESKFDWLEGSIVPMASGTTTDLAYDLGTSTARWLNVWAKNIKSGSQSLAVNGSQSSVDIAGTKPMIAPRISTTQRNAVTPANGMFVYDSTIEQFQMRENGAWLPMVGPKIGLLVATAELVDVSATYYDVVNVTAAGRLKKICIKADTGSAVRDFIITLDGVAYDSINWATSATAFVVLKDNPATTTSIFGATTAADNVDVYFKTSFIFQHRLTANAGTTTVMVVYERT